MKPAWGCASMSARASIWRASAWRASAQRRYAATLASRENGANDSEQALELLKNFSEARQEQEWHRLIT